MRRNARLLAPHTKHYSCSSDPFDDTSSNLPASLGPLSKRCRRKSCGCTSLSHVGEAILDSICVLLVSFVAPSACQLVFSAIPRLCNCSLFLCFFNTSIVGIPFISAFPQPFLLFCPDGRLKLAHLADVRLVVVVSVRFTDRTSDRRSILDNIAAEEGPRKVATCFLVQ